MTGPAPAFSEWVLVSTREVAGGLIEYEVSVAPARHIRVLVPKRNTTAAQRDAIIDGAVKRARLQPIPPQPPRVV